jgi:hypothetical protein
VGKVDKYKNVLITVVTSEDALNDEPVRAYL